MNIEKGILRREIQEIKLIDGEIAEIIIGALVEKGYDVDSESLFAKDRTQFGEILTIYRKQNIGARR